MKYLEMDYNMVKEYYNFYKTTNWIENQVNKGLSDKYAILQFGDIIIVEDEPKVVFIKIQENLINRYKRFDTKVKIDSQTFYTSGKTLSDTIKWINKLFSKTPCKNCNNFNKLTNNGYCIFCLEKKCIRINTDKICPICLDELNRNVFITKCGHYFHTLCIAKLHTCPICRFNFYEEFNIPDSSDSDN